MDCNEIGSRIKALREKRDITQATLAKALHVKRETVNQWESGTRDLKTAYTVALADYFGVSCDDLLRGVKSENISIHKRTGLSDAAIETLESFKRNSEESNTNKKSRYTALVSSKAVDFMLRNENAFMVFMLTGRYFWDKYSTAKRAINVDTGEETSRVCIMNETAGYEESLLIDGISDSIFIRIQEMLIKMREEAQKEGVTRG